MQHRHSLSQSPARVPICLVPGQMEALTPDLEASAASPSMSMWSDPGPAACPCCSASSQACQMLSVPCSRPSGQHSTATSTQGSAALRLAENALRQQLQPALHQPDAPGPSRIRGARPHPAPARDRRAQHMLLPAPDQPLKPKPACSSQGSPRHSSG